MTAIRVYVYSYSLDIKRVCKNIIRLNATIVIFAHNQYCVCVCVVAVVLLNELKTSSHNGMINPHIFGRGLLNRCVCVCVVEGVCLM